jgi:SAM-dependent methyltransferase
MELSISNHYPTEYNPMISQQDSATDARKTREIDFHNKRFAAGSRGSDKPPAEGEGVGRFYSVVHQSQACYVSLLKRNCAGKKVLEYGCGTGSFAPCLVKWGARSVTGIDISDVAIEKAAKHAEMEQIGELTYLQMDAESLRFDDGAFDLICGTAILHHLDLKNAYSELARTLKADGRAVFLEPLGHNPIINLYRKLTPQLRTYDEHPLLMKDLALASKFFGKIELHYFNLLTLMAVPFRKLGRFGRILQGMERADEMLFRAFPMAAKYAWTVVIVVSEPKKQTRGATNR